MKWDSVKENWALVRGNTKLQWRNLSGEQLIKMAGRPSPLGRDKQKAYVSNSQMMRDQFDDFVGPRKEDDRQSG